MGKTKMLLLLAMVSSMVAIIACRKSDWQKYSNNNDKERFFNLPVNSSATVRRAAAVLLEAETRQPFAVQLVQQSGFPLWDKATAYYDAAARGGDTILLIPLVPDGSRRVHAILELRMSNNILLRVLGGDDFKSYPHGTLSGMSATAERFSVEFMKIEYRVFGYNTFTIKNDSLFRHSTLPANAFLQLKLKPIVDSSALVLANDDCYEVEIWYDPDGISDPDHNSGNEYFTGETYFEGNCGTNSGGGYPGGFGIFGGGNPVVVSGWTINAPPTGSGPGWTNWPVYHPPNGWVPTYINDADCPPLINELQQDTAFISKLKELNHRDVTNLSYEKGYEVRNRSQAFYEPVSGSPNSQFIQWNIYSSMDGFMHSHYRNLNSIFSPQDMVLMAKMWLNRAARDSTRFFLVVTSADAYPYLVVVNDVAKYRKFAERITKDSTATANYLDNYDLRFNFQDIEKNEKGFLEMLQKETKGGISLYRSGENCNTWTRLELHGSGSISTTFCFD